VIVYQILYTDVSNHLSQYATMKAMGFTDGYLVRLVLKEAVMLAALRLLARRAAGLGACTRSPATPRHCRSI
jgi:putative ABC transport system permease protein